MRANPIAGGGFGFNIVPVNNIARLNAGDTVTASFGNQNRMRTFFSTTATGTTNIGGVWPGNTMNLAAAGFVGVAINNAGSTNYGWIRIGISNDATGAPVAFTVYDWAYETEANTPITVGLIPEPSPAAGLALLAAGAAGIAAWRRRKQPTA